MRKDIFIRQEAEETKSKEIENAHQEAVDFVEKHRDFLEHYNRGQIKVEPAPEGLDTFAFNLKNNTIYVSSKFYETAGFSFSDEETSFATCHEIEHFLEKKQLLSENRGEENFENWLKKIEKDRAYKIMDNCLADIRENKTIIKRTNEINAEIERLMYKENLFKKTDFTNQPKHIQLPQAILYESRVPDELCQVAPEVRKKIEELRSTPSPDGKNSVDIVDIMTNPEIPMSIRMRLQDHFVWPKVQELLEKDLEEEEKKNSDEGEGEKGELKDKSEDKDGSKDKKEKEGQGKKDGKGKAKKLNPNQIFKDAYDEADKKTPNAVPIESIKKVFEEWKESKGEDPLERADNEYAKKLGVKKAELQKYRNLVKSLEKIINPKTGENIVQELRNLIERIIAKKLKSVQAPQYPVEEGEDLIDSAQLVADVKAGNLEPKVWETTEVKKKKCDRFGEVEITLVCDRSNSMEQGNKLSEQQKAAVLMMEALKEFAERCDEERVNLEKPLEVKSEIYSFQQDSNDSTPLKKMSKELGEKERIKVANILSSAPGERTTDYVTLKAILKNLDDETKKKIIEGELKKIVIVFTDGKSHDEDEVKKNLKALRENGVIIAVIGITKDGKAALTTYGSEARLAEKAEDLATILAELLEEHLINL